MSGILNSSIGRKFAMALSALFLMFFLLQHFAINILSVFSADAFNTAHISWERFGRFNSFCNRFNFWCYFSFVMGFILEIKNNKARKVSYAKNNGSANSTWMSRNMLLTGAVVLAFMVLHFIDFWIPEINTKYIVGDMSRYA